MIRVRMLFALALSLSTALVGCGTKADPTAANKAEARKRLERIGTPFSMWPHGASFPVGVVGENGRLGLSWRVAILPYIGEDALYKEFRLNEPWDSEHNKKLIPKMPEVYASPGKDAGVGKTYLRSFVGPKAFIPASFPQPDGSPPFARWPRSPAGSTAYGRTPSGTPDGTGNTLMVVEAHEAIEWTNPEEFLFLDGPPDTPNAPKPSALPNLGGVFPGGFHAIMCDGRVHFFPDTLSEKTIRAMITADAADVLDKEADDIIWPEKQNHFPKSTAPSARD